jgi:heat shock protein HslJ
LIRTFRSLRLLVFLLAVLLGPVPSRAALPSAKQTIHGTATYRERVALTHGAVFEARLLDVSRPGGSGPTLARMLWSNPGQVPISFELHYDPRRLEARRTYVVRATITEGNWVRFTGEAPYAAPGRGREARVTVLMRAMGRDSGGRSESGLEDTRWVPVRIAGRSVPAAGGAREAWIELDSRSRRFTGSGSCNRIGGGYEACDGALQFGPITATRMACIDMKTETAFLSALERTRRYRVFGRRLELMGANGNGLATLEERNLR